MLGASIQRWVMSCQDQCESRNARAVLGTFSIKLSALPLLAQRKVCFSLGDPSALHGGSVSAVQSLSSPELACALLHHHHRW